MPPRTNNMAARTGRSGKGKFTRTAESRRRDHKAAELRGQGWSYDRIAAELRFASRGHAHDAVMRAFAEIPSEESAHSKALDLERIDRLIEQAWQIMLRDHVTVSQGRGVGKQIGWQRDDAGEILRDGEGAPIGLYEDILDDGPALAAIREIRALIEHRTKIFGYAAPARSRVEVITEDVVDAEIAALTAEMEGRDAVAPGTGAS